ncbi:MAG: hypothetical protein WBK28_02980 [Minisyncoccia bacterium]
MNKFLLVLDMHDGPDTPGPLPQARQASLYLVDETNEEHRENYTRGRLVYGPASCEDTIAYLVGMRSHWKLPLHVNMRTGSGNLHAAQRSGYVYGASRLKDEWDALPFERKAEFWAKDPVPA